MTAALLALLLIHPLPLEFGGWPDPPSKWPKDLQPKQPEKKEPDKKQEKPAEKEKKG